jgi:hypothetical protein
VIFVAGNRPAAENFFAAGLSHGVSECRDWDLTISREQSK